MTDLELKVDLIHFGEDLPCDPDYRPIRHGRFAEILTDAGCTVRRVGPNFSHSRREFRSVERGKSVEGEYLTVPTRGYGPSRGSARALFIRDFGLALADFYSHAPFPEIIIVGAPPPSLIHYVRGAVGGNAKIVADIRDLWPDAFFVGRASWQLSCGRLLGKLISNEIRLADAAIGVSDQLVGRAPASKRNCSLPIGIDSHRLVAGEDLSGHAARFCFVGTLTPSFDFGPCLQGWVESGVAGSGATMDIFGMGAGAEKLGQAAEKTPGVEFRGRIPSDEVPNLLAAYDVGLAPYTPGFGTHFTNKIFEYLGAGMYVLHSLEEQASRELLDIEAGVQCRSVDGWALGFKSVVRDIEHMRDSRRHRTEMADKKYGIDATRSKLLSLIAAVSSK